MGDLFANFGDGTCSIMGYNWVVVENTIAKMQWLSNAIKSSNIKAIHDLFSEFHNLVANLQFRYNGSDPHRGGNSTNDDAYSQGPQDLCVWRNPLDVVGGGLSSRRCVL